MPVRSRWLVILIGSNATGKTNVQRNLVELLNGRSYGRVPSNTLRKITHPSFIRKCRSVFVAGRSYQEFNGYGSIEKYFREAFVPLSEEADLAFMSSHLNSTDVQEMISQGRRRFYNVCGLFFSNSIGSSRRGNARIAELAWDELWLAENRRTTNRKRQQNQLWQIAESVLQIFIARQHIS